MKMTFEKKMLYLGMQEMTFQDGKKMYTVELFSQDEGSVKVNVMQDQLELLAVLMGLSFGNAVTVVFRLRAFDKAYKLGMVSVVKDGKAA